MIAKLGDIIVVSVKSCLPVGKVKKGEVIEFIAQSLLKS